MFLKIPNPADRDTQRQCVKVAQRLECTSTSVEISSGAGKCMRKMEKAISTQGRGSSHRHKIVSYFLLYHTMEKFLLIFYWRLYSSVNMFRVMDLFSFFFQFYFLFLVILLTLDFGSVVILCQFVVNFFISF